MKNKILLVWENNPEGCIFYTLDENESTLELLTLCQNTFIGSNDNDATMELSDRLGSEWADRKVGPENPIDGPFTKVFYCGIIF